MPFSLRPFSIPARVRELLNHRGKAPDEWPEARWERARNSILTQDTPKVSVVLIALNEEEGILPALVSLTENRKTFPFEILLVDNGSTDRTAGYAEELGVKVIHEPKKGYAFARQTGLNAASGDYVLTGDADTIYGSKWIDKMTRPLHKNSRIACVYGVHVLVPEEGHGGWGLQFYQIAKWLSQRLKGINRPHLNCGGASMGYRRKEADDAGGYVNDGHRGEDGKLALKLSKLGRVHRVRSGGARIYTSMRRTAQDGSLMKAFWVRFTGTMRYFSHYFVKQKED